MLRVAFGSRAQEQQSKLSAHMKPVAREHIHSRVVTPAPSSAGFTSGGRGFGGFGASLVDMAACEEDGNGKTGT
eukprot:scaffold207546_cov30-Tisochrysis_lutea.AAC.2